MIVSALNRQQKGHKNMNSNYWSTFLQYNNTSLILTKHITRAHTTLPSHPLPLLVYSYLTVSTLLKKIPKK